VEARVWVGEESNSSESGERRNCGWVPEMGVGVGMTPGTVCLWFLDLRFLCLNVKSIFLFVLNPD
jgi:hypothetical protein